MIWLGFGFSSLGLLIGIISGLSETPIAASLLIVIITFAGGSIVSIIRGQDPNKLKVIGQSLFFFSLFTLVGLFVGIFLREPGQVPSLYTPVSPSPITP